MVDPHPAHPDKTQDGADGRALAIVRQVLGGRGMPTRLDHAVIRSLLAAMPRQAEDAMG